MRTVAFEAIGTHWVLDVYSSVSDVHYNELIHEVNQLIEVFDRTYSRFRNDSLIHQIAHSKGVFHVPDEGTEMLRLYEKLFVLTNGAYTPLIGSVMEEAGYDSSYSLTAKTLHKPRSFSDVISFTPTGAAVVGPVLLDFGALGKGYLIDLVAACLAKKDITYYSIDAGGDILYKNKPSDPLRVGLEHPERPDQVIGVATIQNQSIAASAGNRRKWREYHHIINPLTLQPVTNILAVWVIAETAVTADALATALFFSEPETFTRDFNFQYLIVYPDYSLKKSADFPGEVYTDIKR